MVVFRSIADYRNVMNKRAMAIQRSGDRSSLASARFMVAQAKRLAPRDTGETMQGIKKRRLKSGRWVAESTVRPKGRTKFRQNLWANRTNPHRNPKMVWNKGRPVLYGHGHATSGTPRFWDIAAQKTRRLFGRVMNRNTVNALRIST